MRETFTVFTALMLICILLPLLALAITMGYRYILRRRQEKQARLKW